MSRVTPAIFSLLLMAIYAATALAEVPTSPSPPPIGILPNPNEVAKCWSSLENIQGCIWEIYTSVFSGNLSGIGSACCKAFIGIEESCWPNMFPSNPFFPPLLGSTCSARKATPPGGN
ncbi:putative Prolamin-like domain-containing protein [Rosa chinensis]|uniref:Putative Prolamin-like domain-containing protein n=1 Tax=Rosa chinensis TaxID=74649 RepID=A0A2P6S9P1_ROSCH|nr:putative Prolamin-like domain-containing protein [Rosa chinensis]